MENIEFALAIDHLLIGTPELGSGCRYMQDISGAEPVVGGVHPGMGTCNALLGLEDDIYIEIIAPDPEQSADLPLGKYLRELKQTALMWWVARVHDFDAVEERLRQQDIEPGSRGPGSRCLPDGSELKWELLIPAASEFQAALPFFIKWQDMSMHPSRNLPLSGTLNTLQINHPESDKLHTILGSSIQTGDGSAKGLQAELNICGNAISLATPGDFPPAIGAFL